MTRNFVQITLPQIFLITILSNCMSAAPVEKVHSPSENQKNLQIYEYEIRIPADKLEDAIVICRPNCPNFVNVYLHHALREAIPRPVWKEVQVYAKYGVIIFSLSRGELRDIYMDHYDESWKAMQSVFKDIDFLWNSLRIAQDINSKAMLNNSPLICMKLAPKMPTENWEERVLHTDFCGIDFVDNGWVSLTKLTYQIHNPVGLPERLLAYEKERRTICRCSIKAKLMLECAHQYQLRKEQKDGDSVPLNCLQTSS